MPRRLAITGPHRVEVVAYEDRPLEAHEVRIRTELASGKHGTTMALFESANFRGQRFDQAMWLFVPAEDKRAGGSAFPLNTGTTGVGSVVETGLEARRWRVGDQVFGLMDVRETNVCHEDWLWELGRLDPELALCIEPAYVAFHAIRESQVRLGDKVAIIGLGAIGLLAVRMAVGAGAEQVIAVDPLPARRVWATGHGAHHALDPAACDAALETHRLTGGPGVDVAIEVAGSYDALETALRATRITGTVCSAGFYQGESYGLWLGREWHHNRLNIVVPHGCGWGHPPRDFPRWDEQRAYDAIIGLMRQGTLTAPGLVRPIVSLQEGPEVFRLMEQEPNRVMKFAVRF